MQSSEPLIIIVRLLSAQMKLDAGLMTLCWNVIQSRGKQNRRRDFLLTNIVYQLLSRWIPQFQRRKMAYPDHMCLRPQWFYTISLELRLTRTAHSWCKFPSRYNDQKQFLNLDFIISSLFTYDMAFSFCYSLATRQRSFPSDKLEPKHVHPTLFPVPTIDSQIRMITS